MHQPLQHTIRNNNFWVSSQRCLFWEEENALVLSDLHFGKTGHFRKAGIAVPQDVYKEDLQRLVSTIQHFKANQLIIVGDLFHSHHNKELEWFRRWRSDLSSLEIHLIKGNHDILHDLWYTDSDMVVYDEELIIKGFSFRHDPGSKMESQENKSQGTSQKFQIPNTTTECPAPNYLFCGHVHPGISIRGMARQSLHFPCFHFTDTHCVLPAFSRFTGTYSIAPQKGEKVYAIVEDSLISV
jgi:DNA ligase-associated metallophosphoesterase